MVYGQPPRATPFTQHPKGKEPCVMEEEVADLMDAHTPSVSSVRQASQSLITSHIKPSRFTHSSVSPVQQASSITSPVKPSSFTRSSVSPVWQGSSITSPVKPSSFIRSSVSPVRQASHSPSVTSPNSSDISEPSLSALTTSTCHVNIREEADKEYLKNVERMKIQYAKRRQHQCNTTVQERLLQYGYPKMSSHQLTCHVCCAMLMKLDMILPATAKIAKDSWSKELLSLLEDEPYRMVTHHGLAQTGDYDAVCDCIQRSYAPLGSELEWQLKVRTRVQKVGESLMEFCGALRGMADKAFPAWPAEQ
ncbi:hypothetical protein EMCRGX_G013509 [Ephydatia muelleri]